MHFQKILLKAETAPYRTVVVQCLYGVGAVFWGISKYFSYSAIRLQCNHFVCYYYYAIKWSIIDLKGQFLHGSSMEFDGNNVGMHPKFSLAQKCYEGITGVHSND